jgi:CheY-like chemotaxis protein
MRTALPLTILFVEDETAVREVVIRMLVEKGFQVFACADGAAALRILRERRVDLLFTDIVLPTINGVELARQARRLRPGIKVLFTTGYAQKAAEAEALRLGKILLKPWRQTDLIAELKSLLGTV